MRIGQPGVQRCESNFCAVTQQQKNKGDVQERWIEITGALDQQRPDHRGQSLAHRGLRRHVYENRTE